MADFTDRFVSAFAGSEPWVAVTLKGHEGVPLFVEAAVLRGEHDGPLAPAHHIGENGQLRWSRGFEDSYAHVEGDGLIRRYNEVIGHLSDLSPVTSKETP